MLYTRLILFYFSGTGNARNAALWFEQVARESGVKTLLVNIEKAGKVEIPEVKGKTLIGFFSPTHGFNLPPNALRFILRFPRHKNADVFLVNTRAGMKLHKLYIPGLSGLAQYFPALILKLKGFRIRGMQPLDLPSNWLLLHPGLKGKVVDSVYSRCRNIMVKFAQRMLSGKPKYKAFLSLPFDLAIAPMALAYYFFGRFFLAKTLLATEACNNCGICVEKCPVSAISMINERPFWRYTCESCMRCVNACPKQAIETVHGFSVGMLLFSSLVLSPLILAGLDILGLAEGVQQSVINEKIWTIIYTLIFLVFVFVSYRILHYLMRFRWVSKIIAYTSLSKYKFWRRYKAPKTFN